MPYPFRSSRFLVLAAVLAALGVLAIVTTLSIRASYERHLDDVFAQSDKAAIKLADRTREALDTVSQATLLVDFLDHQGSALTLKQLFDSGVVSRQLTKGLYRTDAQGFVEDTTLPDGALNVADEDFFKLHLRSPDLGVHIGQVWQDPIDKSYSIPLTRRLERHGKFAGIVTAVIDPAVLSVNAGRLEAAGTSVGVIGFDGYFRARYLDGTLTFGARVEPNGIVERAALSRKTRQASRSPVDGVMRFVSLVPIESYPLYAVLAVDADEALAEHRKARDRTLALAGFVTLGILLAGGLLATQASRLDAGQRQTKAAEAAFRATLEGSLDSVAILAAVRGADGQLIDMVIKDCNTPAAELAGRARVDIVGRLLCDVTPTIRPFLKHFEQCMQSGARQDAQVMAFEPHLAGHWLHHQLVPLEDGVALITRDVTERVVHEASLHSMARLDALTGLPNRRAFEEALIKAHARCRRAASPLALVAIDLDGFKAVNDRLGHAAGDAVLVEVARRLQALLRNVDTVCRLGGDEFAVIVENVGAEADLAEVCRRIQRALSSEFRWNDADATTTPSIGCAVHRIDDEVAELMARADAAMYRAKAAGKARFDLVAS